MKERNRRWRFFSFEENEEVSMTNLVERLSNESKKQFSLSLKMRRILIEGVVTIRRSKFLDEMD